MKTVATPCMIAVPSMLTVAPSGIVKEATELWTPSFSSVVRRFTGRVALLLAVLKATLIGARNLRKKVSGDNPANTSSIG
jgi:type IV secretory pathway VirB2 component (pilin)